MSADRAPAVQFPGLHSRIDLAIRLVLVAAFAFWAASCFKGGIDLVRQTDFTHPSGVQIGRLLSVLSIGLFTLMYAIVYAIRLKPVSKFPGLVPCAVAIAGGFMMLSLALFTPRTDLPLWAQALAAALVIIGNILSAATLLWLGRSFSIVPESRRLVTDGPYAIVRNPLYLAEAVATLGVVVDYLSLWTVLLFVAQLGLQMARIYYEERVLRASFTEYEEYSRRTSRLVPGLY